MPKNITIYTTNTCAYCAHVKRWLDGKGLGYKVINLDEQPDRQAEIYAKSGALTVPVTLVEQEDGREDVVVGFNLAKLAPAVA